MKYKFALTFLIALIFSSIFSFAYEKPVLADSGKKDEKGIDIIVVCGLGLTTSFPFFNSNIWGWDYKFNLGPTIALGLEIPFTKSHIFSAQVYGNYWIGKYAETDNPNEYIKNFYDLSNGFYSQFEMSAIIKWYIVNKNKKVRFAFHLGGLFYSMNENRTALETGYSIYYKVNPNLNLNLFRRLVIPRIDLGGGGDQPAPCLLMLNLSYKFNL